MSTPLPKVNKKAYLEEPERYELRSGSESGAPLCPYGNHYKWIGYDKVRGIYRRVTKAVFKKNDPESIGP